MSKSVLTAEHQQLLKEFKEFRAKNNQTYEPTEASIKKFLGYIGDKSFSSLTSNDYKGFFCKIAEQKNMRYTTYHNYHGNLTSFFTFLTEKGVKLNFLEERQRVFNEFVGGLESKEVRKEQALEFSKWLSLKETLELAEEYRLLFFVEIIYQYQLKNTSQMMDFYEGNYTGDYFVVPKKEGTKSFFISPALKNIIKRGGMPDNQLKASTINYQFKKIENFSKEKILIGDIYLTSIQNFFVCPNCRQSYENIPENWAVFDYGESYKQLILCRKRCYERVINGQSI